MSLSIEDQKVRAKKIREFVQRKFNEKDITIGEDDLFRKSLKPPMNDDQANAFALSILDDLNNQFENEPFWFQLTPNINSLSQIFAHQHFAPSANKTAEHETFEEYLKRHELDVFGTWSDSKNEFILEIDYRFPDQKAAWIEGKSKQLNAVGLVGDNPNKSDPEKPPSTAVAKRTVATGVMFFCEQENMKIKLVAEFTYTDQGVLKESQLRICPDTKKDAPDEYSYVLINPEKNVAKLLSQEDVEIAVMSRAPNPV